MSESSSGSRSGRGWLLRTHEWALVGSILAVIAVTAMADANHAYLRKPRQCLTDNLRNLAPIGMLALRSDGGHHRRRDRPLARLDRRLLRDGLHLPMIVLSPEGTFGVGKPLATWIVVMSCLGAMLAGLMVGTLHTWLIVAATVAPIYRDARGLLVGLRFARAITSWVTRNYRGGGTGSEEIQFNERVHRVPRFQRLDLV